MRDYANRERLSSFIAKRKPIRPLPPGQPAPQPYWVSQERTAVRNRVASWLASLRRSCKGITRGCLLRQCFSRQRPAPPGVREEAVVCMQPTAASKGSHSSGGSRGGGCCENAPEFGQTHDNRWSQGANRAVFRHAGRNEKNALVKPQVRELRDRGTPPRRIAGHRLSSICLNSPPLFQQGSPPIQERINSFRFGSRTCIEGRTPYPHQSSSRAAADARHYTVAASERLRRRGGERHARTAPAPPHLHRCAANAQRTPYSKKRTNLFPIFPT